MLPVKSSLNTIISHWLMPRHRLEPPKAKSESVSYRTATAIGAADRHGRGRSLAHRPGVTTECHCRPRRLRLQ
eukprot:767028-Hanusia_phi.AAC.1